MRTFRATKTLDGRKLHRTHPAESDYDQLIGAPARLVDEEDNVLVSLFEAPPGHGELRQALNRLQYTKVGRTGGMTSYARTFGAMPRRTLRQDFCSHSLLKTQDPEIWEVLERWGIKADEIIRDEWPEAYQRSEAVVSQILPEWRIGDTIFTSGIVNQTTALTYHRDSGNFSENVSAMYVFKRDVQGGHLVLPEYRVALSFEHPSFVVFEGQNITHGVSSMHKRGSLAYRYSLVYYAMKGLAQCGTCAEELLRIKELRTQRELKRSHTKPKGVSDE